MVSVFSVLLAESIIRFFTADPAVIAYGGDCIRIVSYSYVFFAFGMVAIQAFNGAGDTTTPTWINLVCFWFLQTPLAWLAAHPLGMGPKGVFLAITFAQSILAVVAMLLFRRGKWKERKV